MQSCSVKCAKNMHHFPPLSANSSNGPGALYVNMLPVSKRCRLLSFPPRPVQSTALSHPRSE